MILSRRLLVVTLVALVVSAVVELLFVIVVVSKWFGHTFVMRHDDPYTSEPVPHDQNENKHG